MKELQSAIEGVDLSVPELVEAVSHDDQVEASLGELRSGFEVEDRSREPNGPRFVNRGKKREAATRPPRGKRGTRG